MTSEDTQRRTGGYVGGTTLTAIAGVTSEFNALLERVQGLPFVPSSWASDVKAAMVAEGGTWQPRYAISPAAWAADKAEPMLSDVPTWLTSDPQAARAWNELTDWWKERLQPILAGWARSEAATLEAANADAKFFNRLYAMVKPIAVVGDIVLEAPAAVAGAASNVVMGTLRAAWPLLLVAALAGLAFLAYKGRIKVPGVKP
jgi:hypothetical protein